MIGRALGALVGAAILGWAAGATAQDAPTAGALIREAAAAERRAAPAEAVSLYEQVLEVDPTSRLAGRARRRLDWLRARDEGDFEPLAAFLAFRARPAQRRERAEIESFEAIARGFPAGRVRRESWPMIAGAWARAEAHARAEAAWRALLDEPGLTDAERIAAQTGIARARAARGGAAAGAEHLAEAGLEATPTHEALAREASRQRGRVIAWALIALFVVVAVAVGRRELASGAALRAAFAPARIGAATIVLAGPLLLATRYDHDAADTFSLVAAAGAGVLSLASLAGAASSHRGAPRPHRLALAACAALAYGAIGYLALDRAGELLSFA